MEIQTYMWFCYGITFSSRGSCCCAFLLMCTILSHYWRQNGLESPKMIYPQINVTDCLIDLVGPEHPASPNCLPKWPIKKLLSTCGHTAEKIMVTHHSLLMVFICNTHINLKCFIFFCRSHLNYKCSESNNDANQAQCKLAKANSHNSHQLLRTSSLKSDSTQILTDLFCPHEWN